MGNGIDRNPSDLRALQERWSSRLNRDEASSDYREEWYGEQWLHCRFLVPLQEPLGYDYGACANPESPFDAHVMFEHDGCDWFAAADSGVESG